LAQETTGEKDAAPDRAKLTQLRIEGGTALYNLDYETARRKFAEIVKSYPDHPVGPLMLASTLWLEKLNEARRLQAALYSTQSFYAKTEEKPDARTVAQFRTWVSEAKKLAQARVARDPRDAEALYYLGATSATKGAFEATFERRFMAALSDASSGVDRLREVIKLDPGFHDAELTIGLYDYVVASLPLPVRLVGNIAGFHGSRKRGIETLKRVAAEARWNRDDAKVVLLGILKREKRFGEALDLSRELSEKYPRNYLFKLESGDSLALIAAAARKANQTEEAEKDGRDATAIFEELLRDQPKQTAAAPLADLIHFRYGEALLVINQSERAAKEFLASAGAPSAESGLSTLAHLRAANALDLVGKRDAASAEYRAVLGRTNVYNSQDEARKGLREPYKSPAQ
jgi:tetratricopeptide (TPR) repeat protein